MSERIRFHLDENVKSAVSIGQIIEAFVLIYDVYAPVEMVGCVEFL